MYRTSAFSAAVVAAAALWLAGCTGETPTSPKPNPTPGGGGSCAVTITLPAGPIEAFSNTAISVRAQVTTNGQPVPDNSSVSFTTDFGFFNENGLPTLVKSTMGGAADVSPGALSSGTAHVRATYDCASATVQINFQVPPDSGPYISDVQPNTGSAAGGDTVIVYGGGFGTSLSDISSVTFGGVPSGPESVANTRITVRTPPYTLRDPAVPETVTVCVRYYQGVAPVCTPKPAFTYYGLNPNKKVFISSVSPSSGSQTGGDAVTVQGGNFGTSTATTRVTFCGLPATVTSVTDTAVGVLTPAHPNTNPTASEVCDVVVTIDLGKPFQQSAVLPQAFTYTPLALEPKVYSISPVAGPNDNPTRVTVFGTGFQFPEQVFLTGGGCGSQRIEAPVVSPISLTQFVFETPRAVGADACLAGSLVDVQVRNPLTGKQATSPVQFQFYGCPTASNVSPAVIPAGATTIVTVTGTNFVSPVQATFSGGGAPAFQLNVVSVSATSVLIQMPPLSTISPSLSPCQSVSGTISLQSTSLGCTPVTVSITYRADTPTISSFSPTTASQPGGALITVLGSGFTSSMTATITKDGSAISAPVVATVTDSGTLSFAAPFIPDSAFNRQNCLGGTQAIPTTFGVRVTNSISGCSSTLSGLVITPTNTACTSALAITTSSLPAATACSAYSQAVSVSGGTPPYFNFTATNLPTGLSINSSTGLISGTPVLTTSGAGGSAPMTVLLTVQDTVSSTASRSVPILFSDPTGPFTVNGVSPQTVPPSGPGPASAFSVTGGTGTINWVIDSGPAGLSLASATGATNSFVSSGLTPLSGPYSVTVRATDSLCAPAHTNTVTVTVNVGP